MSFLKAIETMQNSPDSSVIPSVWLRVLSGLV